MAGFFDVQSLMSLSLIFAAVDVAATAELPELKLPENSAKG